MLIWENGKCIWLHKLRILARGSQKSIISVFRRSSLYMVPSSAQNSRGVRRKIRQHIRRIIGWTRKSNMIDPWRCLLKMLLDNFQPFLSVTLSIAHHSQELVRNGNFYATDLYKREKKFCPACGEEPLSGSSDANMKCRHLKSAGVVRKQKNFRE